MLKRLWACPALTLTSALPAVGGGHDHLTATWALWPQDFSDRLCGLLCAPKIKMGLPAPPPPGQLWPCSCRAQGSRSPAARLQSAGHRKAT